MRYQNVVDDVLMQLAGGAKQVKELLAGAMTGLVDLLDANDLVVSWKKARLTASDAAAPQAMGLRFAEEDPQLERVARARNLGCDATDGRRRRRGFFFSAIP